MRFPFTKKTPVPPTEEPDKAMSIVSNNFDAEKELSTEPERMLMKVTKTADNKPQIEIMKTQLSASTFSLESQLESGGFYYTNTAKYWNYYASTSVLRKCINLIAGFTARAGFETTIRCLDEDDDPEKPEYLEVKKKIDEVNRVVNMDHVIFVTQIKRYLYGMCGWQIVPGSKSGKIVDLQPLQSGYMTPRVDKIGQFQGVEYWPAKANFIPKEMLLFFNLDTLEINATDMQGLSSICSIEREIKIKKNLQRDLLYASRSLWAPIIIYQADTRGMTPAERVGLINDLKTDLKPGGVVVTNRAVDSTVIQSSPDLNNLIRAIQLQDEDIIGNYGIPKALLSREKTEARATLEFSIKSFYESSISMEQQYLKRQLEKQWYDPMVKSLGYADKIRIRHEWRPILDPASDLIVALTRAYDSGIISGDEFFRRLGWELDRATPDVIEKPPQPAGQLPPVEEQPPTKKITPKVSTTKKTPKDVKKNAK
jgi:hypothetical protein